MLIINTKIYKKLIKVNIKLIKVNKHKNKYILFLQNMIKVNNLC